MLVLIVIFLIALNLYKYLIPSKVKGEITLRHNAVPDTNVSDSDYGVASLKLPNVDKLFTFRDYKAKADLFNYYDDEENSLPEQSENEVDVIAEVEARDGLVDQPVVDAVMTEVLAVSHHADGSTALLKINGKVLSVKVGDVLSTGHVVSRIEGTSIIVKDVVQH